MAKQVVYTAITGGYDNLKPIPKRIRDKADYIAYLDEDITKGTGWEFRKASNELDNSYRDAKKYKILPHKYFPEYEYSLWVDGSIEVETNISKLVERYLNGYDWAVFKHPQRDCVYEEGMTCGSLGKDDPDVIARQLARYWHREHYPRNNGLAENTVILRRHNTPKVIETNKLWWDEIQKGSRRDQISFNYCAWKTGLKFNYMEGSVYKNKYFNLNQHLK